MPYIGTSPSNGVRRVHTYTATASQTTFTGASSEGVTLSYVDTNYIDVFQNGILLGSADYTSTSGTSVVLAQGASADDLIVIVVYDVFSVADTVSKTNGGSFDSAVTMSGDLTISDKIIHDGDTNTAIRFPSADTVTIETGGSERARIDSNGDLLIGKTSSSFDSSGIELKGSNDTIFFTRSGTPLFINRLSSNGDLIEFYKDGTSVGRIAKDADGISFGDGDTGLKCVASVDSIVPFDSANNLNRDNAIDLGFSSVRFDDVRATNGTIQTSDRNDKQDIEELSDAEQRVAVVAKGLMRKYRWKDKVAEKGDNARTHFGIIAQDLQDAFTAEGLDAGDYAMFISDTWWYVDEKFTDDDGKEQTRTITYLSEEEAPKDAIKKTRLGIRYSELLAFIISAL